MPKIVGWEIKIYCVLHGRTYLDYRVEYGNSPIRDKKSRNAFISELISRDAIFEVSAIWK